MMEKRMSKMESARPDLPELLIHGDPHAEIGIIGYGSNRGPIVEAQDRLAASGVATKFLEMRTLWPFPEDDVRAFIDTSAHVFVVENNFTGQLERLVRYVVGPLERMHRVLKYNGRPFRPIEVIEPIEQIAGVRSLAGAR
jgi:pyruvate/2-oxoacid:ferredoxin oxidoreductase alpha subunit